MRGDGVRKPILIPILVIGALLALPPAPASPHWTGCGGGKLKWGSRNQGLDIADNFDGAEFSAANDARISIDGTDFNLVWDPFIGDLEFKKRNDGPNGVVGTTVRYFENCLLGHTDSYYNTYYTNFYSESKLQAVAIHELGHALGMNHFFDGCVLRSIMQSTLTCLWDSLGINTVQTHDRTDINATY